MFQFDQLISGGAQDCVRGGQEAGDGEGCEEGEEDTVHQAESASSQWQPR